MGTPNRGFWRLGDVPVEDTCLFLPKPPVATVFFFDSFWQWWLFSSHIFWEGRRPPPPQKKTREAPTPKKPAPPFVDPSGRATDGSVRSPSVRRSPSPTWAKSCCCPLPSASGCSGAPNAFWRRPAKTHQEFTQTQMK